MRIDGNRGGRVTREVQDRDSPVTERAIEQAMAAIRDGDTAAATRIITPFADRDHGTVLRILALCASRERRYGEAARLWRSVEARQPLSRADQGRLGTALEQCGDVAGAFAAYRAFLPAKGRNAGGVSKAAALHGLLGQHLSAIELLDEAVALHHGTPIETEMRGLRARSAFAANRLSESMADYLDLDRSRPDDPAALLGMINIFIEERDALAVRRTLAAASVRFPGDHRFLVHEARLINQQDDERAMLAFLKRISPLGVAAPLMGRIVLKLVNGRNHYFPDALQRQLGDLTGPDEALRRLIFRRGSQESDEAAALQAARSAMVAHSVYPESPAAMVARGHLAEALVNAGETDEAERVIAGLRDAVRDWPYSPPALGRVFEWQDARHDLIDRARTSYWSRRRMIAGLDRSHELRCIRALPGPVPPVVVFCQVRNEMPMLPAFFAHYRRIGVRRFVMIDNGSTDGGLDWLLTQPDVELHHTQSGFRRAGSGNHWFNPLIARSDYADTLCLRVDADEHLVYPHYESRPIGQLWDHMRAEGAEVLVGFMLDMLPETMAALDDPLVDFTRVCRHFDLPWPPTPYILAPYVNHSGGPRSRLLGYRPQFLTKSSGLRGGGGVEQLHASHCTSPARKASVSMTLLHYKFRPDFTERARRIASEHQYANSAQEFACYADWQSDRHQSMLAAESRLFEGSQSLLDAGIIKSTPQWDAAASPTIPPPVTLHWATGPVVRDNWGDKLNPHLVELLTGRPARNADHVGKVESDPIYSVIGSHLASSTARTIVWGTGFIAADDRVRQQPRQICAVRGPISRQMLLDQGIDCPPCYGDPALLLPLFYRPTVRKRHELGVIRHVRDRDTTHIPAIAEGDGVIEIAITGDLLHVVDQILSCRRIASSSLHGIIAAHAYGVPAAWITLSANLKGDGTKFRDYFASIGTPDATATEFGPDDQYRSLFKHCRRPPAPIALDQLIRACPFIDAERKDVLIARL